MSKLPVALKQLLAQRGPNSLPSPGLARLGPVLGSTLKEAKVHKAENGWLCVAVSYPRQSSGDVSYSHVALCEF